MIVATLVPVQVAALTLAVLGAPAVVLTRDPLRQSIVNGIYGYVLVALFVVLQAPDVALSMLVVSGVAYPLIVLVAIARIRAGASQHAAEGGGEQPDEPTDGAEREEP